MIFEMTICHLKGEALENALVRMYGRTQMLGVKCEKEVETPTLVRVSGTTHY